VTVKLDDRTQIGEVMSGSSYYSHNDLRLHFGLGKAAMADFVEVRWPLGLKESFPNVRANQRLVIKENN
jgi:enediyne biosynthesis protein E4